MTTRSPSVATLSFSPAGSHLAWLSNDAKLRVWDGRQVLPPIQLPGGRHLAAGDAVIAVSDDTKPVVRFVDLPSMALLPRISSAAPSSGPILALTAPQAAVTGSPDAPFNGLYAVAQGLAIRVRSYAGENVAAFSAAAVPFCASFDESATRLAVGDSKGTVRVWDFLSHPPPCLSVKAHKSFVSSLSFFSDGKHLVSGGWDGRAQIWDLRNGISASAAMRADVKGVDKIYAVAVPYSTGEDRLVATGGTAGTVRVWRTTYAQIDQRSSSLSEPIATHSAHSSSIYALAFSPDGRHVASGSGDGTVRLFGVPSKPTLLSHTSKEGQGQASEQSMYPASEVEGLYHIRPMDVILKGQRADRQLIFCPSNVVTLSCPICTNAYDPHARVPICSGACGHTFACRGCNDQLWDMDANPKCPICRLPLVDVVPNYELLRILAAAKGNDSVCSSVGEGCGASSTPRVSGLSRDDYVQFQRLSWMEAPEMAYMTRHSCIIFSGKMDGEVVAIRLPSQAAAREQSDGNRSQMTETERHISCLKRLRGPHIAQFYGVSRTEAPDNRVIVVSELPTGGSLANNLSLLGTWGRVAPPETVLSLSLQIVKTVRFLHQSDVSAGWALSPQTIAMTMPIQADWSVRHRVKLMELGGTISRSECSTDIERAFPSDYIGYMAPEMLDEDRSTMHNREAYFQKMCQSDMYSLGIVLWEIASGKRPFEGYRPAQVVAAVVGRGERPGFPPAGTPTELQTLISRLWSQEPVNRPTSKEACDLLETIPSAPPAT